MQPNAVYPNTVTSFVFTNEYVTDATTTDAVTAMIRSHTQKAHNLNINVGVRSNTFGNINNSKCPYLPNLQALINICDFILCKYIYIKIYIELEDPIDTFEMFSDPEFRKFMDEALKKVKKGETATFEDIEELKMFLEE